MYETRRRGSRRHFLAGAAAVAGAAILAACGGGSATETPKPAATSGSSASAVAKPSVDAKALSGTITYWHHFTSDSEMKGLERVTAAFKQKYPNLTVTQENIPNNNFMQKFTAAVQANSRPDTVMVAIERVQDMVAMNGLKDLTDRINSWSNKPYFPDNRWTAATINGKIYGVPAFMFVNWMYYRMDWFQEAGIAGPPKTWAEFQDIAVKITDPTKGRYGFGMRGGDGGEGWVISLLQAFGSPIVDDKGKSAMDAAKATDALRFYTELFTKYKVAPPSAPNDSYSQMVTGFKTGQTGMILHHTGSLKEINDALPGKFMTAPLPAGPAARIADVSPLYNGIMKDDHVDAGWAWVTQWGEADASIGLLEETGYFPASQAVASDPRVTSNPLYGAATETLKFGKLPPQFVGNAGWQKQTVLPTFQKVLLGQMTPAQGADEIIAGLKKATS